MTEQLPWHHVHLTHVDRPEVAAWYGLHLAAHRGKPTPRSENLWFGPNLVQVQSDTAIAPPTLGEIEHIGIGVADIDQCLADILRAGATDKGDGKVCDPWGTPIQLMETGKPSFHHLQIVTQDPQGSCAWYAQNLGGVIDLCPWDSTLAAIQYDTMWLTFRRGTPVISARPIDHIGWYTADIDSTVSRMTANGCEFPIPTRDFGPVRLAFARDPSGLWVELLEPVGGIVPK